MPNVFAPQQLGFSLGQVVLNLFLSFALAYLAATCYRRLTIGPSCSRSFFLTLLVTPVVVAMIIMAIGSNIALSLGLVGALSIIRFRTVIKDTRDMSFLFLVIGIGLCCGAGAYPLAIFGTLFACAVAAMVRYLGKVNFSAAEYILVFRQHGQGNGDVSEAMRGCTSWRRLHSVTELGEDEGREYTYRVHLASRVEPEALMDRLRNIQALSELSLIAPESQLAL